MEGETDQPDMADEWYDANYVEREGSQGFVLNGTINQLMQMATQYHLGEITLNYLNSFLTADTINDINIRIDKDGKIPSTISEANSAKEAILAAAQVAKDQHYGVEDYWNNEVGYDCA